MIHIAKWAGVDDVKIQIRNVVNTPPEWDVPYDNPHSYGATYTDHRRHLELSADEYRKIVSTAHSLRLGCGASVWDVPSVQTALDVGVDWLKIGSPCLTNIALLEAVAQSKKPKILSTGMSTEEEIVQAVNILGKDYDLTILHCTNSYPCSNENVHLAVMDRLRYLFPQAPIGISGHWEGIQIDAAAVALGATMIERHYTLNRSWRGTDHKASLEPDGLRRWVRDVRVVEQAIGEPKIQVLPCEEPARKKLRLDPSPAFSQDPPDWVLKELDEEAEYERRQKLEHKRNLKKKIAKDFWDLAEDKYWATLTACVCGRKSHKVIAEKTRFGLPIETVLCSFCGTVRRIESLSKQGMEHFYKHVYRQLHTGAGSAEERIAFDSRKGEWLANEILWGAPIDSVGEVGAGTGATVQTFAKAMGVNSFYACDYDPATDDTDSGGVAALPDNLDLLFSLHVLEHQYDPVFFLQTCADHVKAGGYIFTVVPYLHGAHRHYSVQQSGDLRSWFCLAHVWEWTKQTAALPHMLAGLKVIDTGIVPAGELATVESVYVLCRRRKVGDEVLDYINQWKGDSSRDG
jgi:N-acetylneuraminate synthase